MQVAGGTQQDRTALATALLRACSGRLAFTGGHPGSPLGAAVDAVVLIAPAGQVIGAAELDLARTLCHRSPHILLALTAVDRCPSWQEVLDDDLERLRAAGVTAAPFAVSVDAHSAAVAAGDPARTAASGIPTLARRLDDIAEHVARRGRVVDRPPGRRPRPTPDRARWQQVLADGMAAASSDVDFELRRRVRAAIADAEGVLEASDPARDWDDVVTWLRARLAHEGEQAFAVLARRTAAVTAALERELGGDPLPRPAPVEPPDLVGHLPAGDAPRGTRRPLLTRGRSMVMSAYGGLMMGLLLPRLAGVHLPVGVIVACALVSALLLGGATLSGERTRQLETSRTRAKSRARHLADDYVLAAAKATKDELRSAHQRLRNECTHRTTEP
ncbi:serine/threonine-protein kinase [Pseudonocardia adelaidensis]|uniref:Uncharacterized protein n=1 Tax=Pseudonocardia adelaidensis TaxID=648754 RepID=A0ABP9NBK2_9PSEU